jgi:hypothetical protein
LGINEEFCTSIAGLAERTVYETGTLEESEEQLSDGLADNCRR